MKIAFVTPWYGPGLPGGMENATYQIVRHLHAAGADVTVLTTTIRDFYADWGKNSHKPGRVLIEGVPVHRFPVERRNKAAFDDVNRLLMHNQPISPAGEQTFINEMFRVPRLYAYIAQQCAEYTFVFTPYMFATTYHGAQICPERSVIIPCLHDESYAHLAIYRPVLANARGLVLYADAERALADALYPPQRPQFRQVLGIGVDDFPADAARFRAKYGLDTPFVLYAGRKEPGKNVPLLLDYWQRYVRQGGAGKLVLIGSGELAIPAGMHNHIIDLGFVPAQDKQDAYAAASLLCQPSINESFSIVLMESWLAGTPVLVHGDCPVTLEHCRKANGGLYFTDAAEFTATVHYLLTHPDTAHRMAAQGRRYVRQNFAWEVLVPQYIQVLAQATG